MPVTFGIAHHVGHFDSASGIAAGRAPDLDHHVVDEAELEFGWVLARMRRRRHAPTNCALARSTTDSSASRDADWWCRRNSTLGAQVR